MNRIHRFRNGFTLVEVLVAMFFIALVVPAIAKGISLASRAASTAKHRNEASGLAEAKMAQILADGTWLSGTTAGDFGADWPDYKWEAAVTPWLEDTSEKSMQQLDLKVTWTADGRPDFVKLSTIAYDRSQTTTTTQ